MPVNVTPANIPRLRKYKNIHQHHAVGLAWKGEANCLHRL